MIIQTRSKGEHIGVAAKICAGQAAQGIVIEITPVTARTGSRCQFVKLSGRSGRVVCVIGGTTIEILGAKQMLVRSVVCQNCLVPKIVGNSLDESGTIVGHYDVLT
jgi:hypothetical protein